MIYVVSDLHGDFDAFKALLMKIDFNARDTMYVLGDVIDRGKSSIELLLYIMKQFNMVLIRGNHEQLMIDGVKNESERTLWYCNNGKNTFNQFRALTQVEQNELLLYIEKTPLYKHIEVNDIHYTLVHGCFPSEYQEIYAEYNPNYYLWMRMDKDHLIKQLDSTIIFGHTPTSNYQSLNSKLKIYRGKNKIGIDCGLVTHPLGQLGCLRLDDLEEFYQSPTLPYETYFEELEEISKFEDLELNNNTQLLLSRLNMVPNRHFEKIRKVKSTFDSSSNAFLVICNFCNDVIDTNMVESTSVSCRCNSVAALMVEGTCIVAHMDSNHDYTIKYDVSNNSYSYVNEAFILAHTLETIASYLDRWALGKPINRLEIFGDYYFDDIEPFTEVSVLIETDKSFDVTNVTLELSSVLGVSVKHYNLTDIESVPAVKSKYINGSLIII